MDVEPTDRQCAIVMVYEALVHREQHDDADYEKVASAMGWSPERLATVQAANVRISPEEVLEHLGITSKEVDQALDEADKLLNKGKRRLRAV